MKALESTLARQPSTGGAVIRIRRILKDHRETSLVSTLLRHRSVLHGLQMNSLSLSLIRESALDGHSNYSVLVLP